MRLHDFLDYRAREQGEWEFAIQGDRRLTYREAGSETNRLANALAELGVPALFHTGQTGVGSGTPGGGGYKLKYSHLMHLDDVAADFPELTIILAHPAVPWQEEQLAVVLHKGNVYMDLSGWSPKYFRPILTQYATTLLQDKVLFGSDYPVLQPDRWLRDFEALEMKPEVRQKILLENARKVLQL